MRSANKHSRKTFSLIAEGNLEVYYHPQYSKTLLAFSFFDMGLKAIYSRKLIFMTDKKQNNSITAPKLQLTSLLNKYLRFQNSSINK